MAFLVDPRCATDHRSNVPDHRPPVFARLRSESPPLRLLQVGDCIARAGGMPRHRPCSQAAVMQADPLHDFAERKTREASSAEVHALVTTETGPLERALGGIGNDWTRRHYSGDFHLMPLPSAAPAITLVFVESRDGNTDADNPEDLGGGATDKHLLYEGLSRAAADAVLAGTATAIGQSAFFSVWHPEIVALRHELGLSRHPAQVVVSATGHHLDLEGSLLFNVPEVPVFLLAGKHLPRPLGDASRGTAMDHRHFDRASWAPGCALPSSRSSWDSTNLRHRRKNHSLEPGGCRSRAGSLSDDESSIGREAGHAVLYRTPNVVLRNDCQETRSRHTGTNLLRTPGPSSDAPRIIHRYGAINRPMGRSGAT